MNKTLTKIKLFVSLHSEIDYGRFDQISTNAKIAELKNNRNQIYYEIYSLKEAIIVCRKYIKNFNLGSGSWDGGRVVDDNFNFVARISFNGRIWDSEDIFNSKEILC